MKELDNLIQEILSQIVLVVKIGEDKVKVHIFVSMKKLRKDQLYYNSIQKNKGIRLSVNLILKRLLYKMNLKLRKKMNKICKLNKLRKSKHKQLFSQKRSKKNLKFLLSSILPKYLNSFRKILNKRYKKLTNNFHFH